jgi:hypothetical protein
VDSQDLAGRTKFGDIAVRGRSLILRLLPWLPALIRDAILKFGLRRQVRKRLPVWDAEIAAADLVMIGGGQLFQDTSLNFPVKLAAVAELCIAHDKPVAIFGVGVTTTWSKPAAALFKVFTQARVAYVAVRDEGSRRAWNQHFAGHAMAPVEVCRDPGLLAASLVAKPHRPARARPVVALCITAPISLAHHANVPVAGDMANMPGFYTETILGLMAREMDVLVFTNGAGEDEACLNQVYLRPALQAPIESGRLTRPERAKTPAALVELIGQADALIAHRLHACVIAYALAIPAVGLAWDSKLEAFFQSVGRADYICPGGLPAADLVALVAAAWRAGMDMQAAAAVADEARRNIGEMLAAMSRPAHASSCRMSSADA